MEDIDSAVMLKEKLLTAGIDEILTHGMGDFSLRRVAASCGASCAAPYKHFKNKEEFIRATIAFIEEKWNHLADQIISSVEDKEKLKAYTRLLYAQAQLIEGLSVEDPVERIVSLCLANIRFKIANPLYGMNSDSFDHKITEQIHRLYPSEEEAAFRSSATFGVSVLTSGTALLMSEGKIKNSQENFEMLRDKIVRELSTAL